MFLARQQEQMRGDEGRGGGFVAGYFGNDFQNRVKR
jgi:hypothetical protein